MRTIPIIAAAILLAPALAATAKAQDAAGANNAGRVVDELDACRAISTAAERLACFDRTSAALARHRERKDLVIVDREEMRKTRRSLFGFTLPSLRLFGGGDDGDKEPEIKEISGTVTSVAESGFRKMLISLDDGSKWVTTETSQAVIRKGDKLRVTRAPFGYFIHAGGILIRAKRID